MSGETSQDDGRLSHELEITVKESTALGPVDDLQELAAEAMFFVDAGLSKSTRRAYAGHWKRFQEFIQKNKLNGVPGNDLIATETALFITSLAKKGQKISTVNQALAAIALAHTSKGLVSPSADEKVRSVVKGMRNVLGVSQDKKTALELSDLKKMCNKCLPTPKGRRDKVMLLMGFLGAFRRSELVGICCVDVTPIPGGLRVYLPRSKTDQTGKGRYVTIPQGKNRSFCPVAALVDWLQSSGIKKGPIFRRTFANGDVGTSALTSGVVGTIVKQYAKEIGLKVEDFGGHSLRAGFVTTAAKNGARDWEIMKTTGHRSLSTLHGYIQPEKGLKNNPAKDFDL
jgi:integrase